MRRSPGVNSPPNVKLRRINALQRLLEIPEEDRNDKQSKEIATLQDRVKSDARNRKVLQQKNKKKSSSSNSNSETNDRVFDFRWGVFTVSTVRRSRSQRVMKSAGSGKKNNKKKQTKKKKEYQLTLISGELHNPAKTSADDLRRKFYGKRYVIKAVRNK